jgi:putative acetyltransferase
MESSMAITIAIESPLQDDVRVLVASLNEYLLKLTPPEFVFHLTVEQMAEPDVTVWIARDNGRAIGCGALKRHDSRIAEVKRMFTHEDYRGQGIGRRILGEILSAAADEGIEEVVLETGDQHPAAWAIYEKAGFNRCGPVLDYPDTEYSVFYHKQLAA